jgi:hypothetical protein
MLPGHAHGERAWAVLIGLQRHVTQVRVEEHRWLSNQVVRRYEYKERLCWFTPLRPQFAFETGCRSVPWIRRSCCGGTKRFRPGISTKSILANVPH